MMAPPTWARRRVDPSGNWGFTETNARNGTHTFTATDTDMNGTSDASLAFSVTVNTRHHHFLNAATTASDPTPAMTTLLAQYAVANASTPTRNKSIKVSVQPVHGGFERIDIPPALSISY